MGSGAGCAGVRTWRGARLHEKSSSTEAWAGLGLGLGLGLGSGLGLGLGFTWAGYCSVRPGLLTLTLTVTKVRLRYLGGVLLGEAELAGEAEDGRVLLLL